MRTFVLLIFILCAKASASSDARGYDFSGDKAKDPILKNLEVMRNAFALVREKNLFAMSAGDRKNAFYAKSTDCETKVANTFRDCNVAAQIQDNKTVTLRDDKQKASGSCRSGVTLAMKVCMDAWNEASRSTNQPFHVRDGLDLNGITAAAYKVISQHYIAELVTGPATPPNTPVASKRTVLSIGAHRARK